MKDRSVVEIEKGVSFGKASGSLIEITKSAVEPDATKRAASSNNKWASWGPTNNQPQQIIDLNTQETTSLSALEFKIRAHFGKGLYFYKQILNPNGQEDKEIVLFEKLPTEIQDFWYENDINTFQQELVANYEWWWFFPVQYICNAAYNKIKHVRSHRTKDIRLAKRNINTGEVPSVFLSAVWPDPDASQYAEVPAFDKMNPFRVANGIYIHKAPSIDRDYYPQAYWQSNMRWLDVAMKIPRWISANINNSINIKYHVEIPEQYFIDLYPEDNYTSTKDCLEARKKAEEELKQEIDKCLAGADNAQKIFYTKFATDQQGNVIPGWKITAITNDMKDTAWLNADATAAARISSAHGVNPSLTALVTGSNLNVGSGSDTREKFNVHMQLHTFLPRQKTLEWFDIVKRVNRWPMDLHLGYRDLMLETLSNAKQGFVTQNEASPTSF